MREICLAETLLQFFTHACYNLHLRHRPVEATQLPLHFPQVLEFLRKVHSSPHITICYTKYSYLLSPCQEEIVQVESQPTWSFLVNIILLIISTTFLRVSIVIKKNTQQASGNAWVK